MRMLGVFFLSFVLAVISAGQAIATDQTQECMELVDQAIAMFKDQGKDSALKAIDDSAGPFVKGELYVFAISMDNIILAHPHEKNLRRMNVNNVQDRNGQYLFRAFKEIVEKSDSGWVDYTWTKPGEKEPSPKRSFVKKVPGEEMYVGAGYYQR